MRTIDSKIVEEVKEFTRKVLTGELSPDLTYHTLDHTVNVVKNAEHIGRREGFTRQDMNILAVSAWFHDTGYTRQYDDHEIVSARLARDFLEARNVDPNMTEQVIQAILATKFPHQPGSRIAEALCDADFMHLADPRYFELIEKLRKEWKKTGVRPSKKDEFERLSLDIFNTHEYHTSYCLEHCSKPKAHNKEILQRIIDHRNDKGKDLESPLQKKETRRKMSYSRGVDSMFKMTARNQINLSSIADNKSNILLSLNGIIISLGIAFLVRRFVETPEIVLPTLVFLSFSLITIVLAILSTRPQISSGKFTREDIEKKKVNLLFFGNFFKMELKDYEWAVSEMINNDEYLYSTMIKDQFFLGKVLARKYKLLRIAYYVFMIGLIVSVGLFVMAFLR